MTETKNAKTSFGAMVALGVIILGVIYAIAFSAYKETTRESRRAAEIAAVPDAFYRPTAKLPEEKTFRAEDALGKTQIQVRKAWGSPDEQAAEGEDSYKAVSEGATATIVTAIYADSKTVQLIVETDGAQQDVAATRAWLGLPREGEVTLGGKAYDVELQSPGWLAISNRKWAEEKERKAQLVAERARARIEKEAASEQAATKKAQREQFASLTEQSLLDDGVDAKVRARGTVLYIQNVLCGRVLLNRMFGSGKAADGLREFGFTKVTCASGYGDGAYMTL